MLIQLIRSATNYVGVKDRYQIHKLKTTLINKTSKHARVNIRIGGHATECEYAYSRAAIMSMTLHEAQTVANQLIAAIEEARKAQVIETSDML